MSILWLLRIYHMNYINLCFVFCLYLCNVYTQRKCMYLFETSHLKYVTNKSYHFSNLPPFLRDYRMLERKWIFVFVFVLFFIFISLKAKISPQILKCSTLLECWKFSLHIGHTIALEYEEEREGRRRRMKAHHLHENRIFTEA